MLDDLERHANGVFVQFAFTDRNVDAVSLACGKRAFNLGLLRIVLGLALCRPDCLPDRLQLSTTTAPLQRRRKEERNAHLHKQKPNSAHA